MNVKKCNQPEFISGLIHIYKNNPCLWKIKSECYTNRVLREKAYLQLLDYYKRADDGATVDTVKNKINNLRSSFRKELKKVKKSKKSATGPEDVYRPTLWYYDLLLFTSDQEPPQLISCDDDEQETAAGIPDDETEDNTKECISSAFAFHDVFEDKDNSLQSPLAPLGNSRASSKTCTISPTKGLAPKRKLRKGQRGIMNKVCNILAEDKQSDEFDTIGENIAHKFRRMNEEQRTYAEHLINNVLYYAVQNKLNSESEIVLNKAIRTENAYNITYHTSQIPVSNESLIFKPELH